MVFAATRKSKQVHKTLTKSTLCGAIGGSLPSPSNLYYRIHWYRHLLPRYLVHGELDRFLCLAGNLGFTRRVDHSVGYQYDWYVP
jgi:hypothetical protein